MSPAEFKKLAQDCVDYAQKNWQLDLDFSPESLNKLDKKIDQTWQKEHFQNAHLGAKDVSSLALTSLVLKFGSYFGEILTKHFQGVWHQSDNGQWLVNIQNKIKANVFSTAEESIKQKSKFYRIYQDAEEFLNSQES